MKYSVILLSLLLTGCVKGDIEGFTPYTPEIRELSTFQNDLSRCRLYALRYLSEKGNINPSQIVQEGAREGSSKLGYVALSPWAPVLGALGAASAETLSQLGLDSKDSKKIVSVCMHDKGVQHNLYSVYDPNL